MTFAKNTLFGLIALILLFFSTTTLAWDFGGKDKSEPKAFVAHDVNDPIFIKVKQPLVLSGLRIARNYYVKTGQKFHFKVSNPELNPVNINEWHAEEALNIRISIAPCKVENEKIIPTGEWKVVWPETQKKDKKIRRSPVVLQAGNYLPVDIPLNFANPGKYPFDGAEIHLAVKAELNLLSVSAQPLIFDIILHKHLKVEEIIL